MKPHRYPLLAALNGCRRQSFDLLLHCCCKPFVEARLGPAGQVTRVSWDSAKMPMGGTIKLLMTGALLAAALAVSGCSTQIADMSLPSDAPPRAKEAAGYLPVHDLPPDRAEPAMKPDEQK